MCIATACSVRLRTVTATRIKPCSLANKRGLAACNSASVLHIPGCPPQEFDPQGPSACKSLWNAELLTFIRLFFSSRSVQKLKSATSHILLQFQRLIGHVKNH